MNLHGTRGPLTAGGVVLVVGLLLAIAGGTETVDRAHSTHSSDSSGSTQAVMTVEAPVSVELPPVASAPPEPEPVLKISEGTLDRGETISAALRRFEIDWLIIYYIDEGMKPVFDFRHARPGDRFEVALDEDGQLVRFEYDRSQLERYVLTREGEAFAAERLEPDLRITTSRIAGVVNASLYEAIDALGESTELAGDVADVFAWDIDFSRSVQPGDEFTILYERRNLVTDEGSEVYIGPGKILAARYTNAGKSYEAFRFESAAAESNRAAPPQDAEAGYYRADGSSVERQFLRAPLKYRRISSRYSPSRLHPILKIRRPHLGIDYAAPRGTPVWTVANGTVIFRGVQGGFGKLLKVRHANGYVTYYGHLSRFSSGLKVGAKIQQKQVIGFVGSTGLSTGPHLDFRLKQNGRYVNPATLDTPPAKPIPAEQMPSFEVARNGYLRELDPHPMVAATTDASAAPLP
ncbi:MAG: M23 family metallopeptidase [Myxococcota bacterium]